MVEALRQFHTNRNAEARQRLGISARWSFGKRNAIRNLCLAPQTDMMAKVNELTTFGWKPGDDCSGGRNIEFRSAKGS